MFGRRFNFFSMPSKEKLFNFLAQLLATAVCVETTTEITLAAAEGGLVPAAIIPYVPIIIGIMAGIQSDLLLEGNELQANAARLSVWINEKLGKSKPQSINQEDNQTKSGEDGVKHPIVNETIQAAEEGTKEDTDSHSYRELNENAVENKHEEKEEKSALLGHKSTVPEDCIKRIEKAYISIAIPTLFLSLPIVPVAKFYLAYFQMQQLLADIFNLEEDNPLVLTSAIISGTVAAYYSFGTEGSSAINWLNERTNVKCNCCPAEINKCTSVATAAIVGRDKSVILPAAVTGAVSYGILQSLSIFQMLRDSEYFSAVSAGCLSGFLFLDMALQNFTFQGREFRKSAKELYDYLTGRSSLSANDELKALDEKQLKTWQKAVMAALDTILIGAPTFIANYALTTFTFNAGFKSYYKETDLENWQINCGIVAAVVASVGEALTETVSAFDEINEFMTHRFGRPHCK